MIYPTARAVWMAAAGAVPAFVVAVAVPSVWYLGLLWVCGLLAFMAADAAAGPGGASLTAGLRSAAQVGVGGALVCEIDARFAGRSPRLLEARVGHDARLTPLTQPAGLSSGLDETRTITLDFKAVRRGIAIVDHLWLRWPGPFGLVWNQVKRPLDHRIAILPDIGHVRDEAIAHLQRAVQTSGHAQRRAGQGREFEALKDYQPGMGRRMIDWKRSARHGRLLAREYRVEDNNHIVLAIDSGRLMCEPVDGVAKVDRAVTAALLAAFVALKGGDVVSLFGFDSRPRTASGAVRGVSSFAVLQRRAAEIDYSSEETNFTLSLATLSARLNQRSLIVIFTDFVDTVGAELMLRGVARLTERHLVLFMMMKDVEVEGLADGIPSTPEDIARAVVAGGLMRERSLVVERLRLLGVHVIEADHRRLRPILVEEYLRLKRESLL